MNVTFDFRGQAFLVTGASSGIGRETARELLAAGATVLGMARHFPEGDELAKEFPERWVPKCVDVTHFDELEQGIADFVAEHGKINGCVHSAGMVTMLPVSVWNPETAHKLMDLNLWAASALLKILWKKKYRQDGLAHVFISTVSVHRAQKSLSIYAASKAGIEALVRTAAPELATRGQRVNSVCLGWIKTNMTKDGEYEVPKFPLGDGSTEDAAGMILYLLSDRARWITGANFVVDGGFLQM